MTLNFYRLFFGFVFLLFVVPFLDKKTFKLTKKDAKDYFFIGFLYATSLSLYTTANLFAPIHNVVLINYVYPFFVLILAYFLLKEKITSTKIITLIIAMIGLSIINPFKLGAYTLGNILALLNAIFYAVLIVEMRKEERTHSIGSVLWFFLFATLLLSPFPFIFGIGNLANVWHYVLLLGFVSTGFAYLLYNLALQKLEVEISAIIAIIIAPVVSIALAVLIVNESLNFRVIIGGVLLIIAGIYLEAHRKKIKSSTK